MYTFLYNFITTSSDRIFRHSKICEELFTKYDADGDQRLSEAEIRAFAKDLGVEVSPEVGGVPFLLKYFC